MKPSPLSPLPPARHSGTAYALALALALALAGCVGGTSSNNTSLNSVHQPVVAHTTLTLDIATSPDGLAQGESRRIAEWFATMNLGYGDKIMLEDPQGRASTRSAVQALLSSYGLLLSHETPATASYASNDGARITIVRAIASVPGCPDWSDNSETNPQNGTSANYGCATNSNIAAMIANPDDLLRGEKGNGASSTPRSTKAINAYTVAAPTGDGESHLNAVASTSGTGS